MQEMYIPGYRYNGVLDRSAVVVIGEYRLKRLPRIAGLEDRIPQIYELSGLDGRVYAVEADKDLLIAFVHCATPRMIGPALRTPVPSDNGTHTLLHVHTVDLDGRPLFDFVEVWDRDEMWGRFVDEEMAERALSSLEPKAA
jgi:hypothetical protein